MCIAWCLGRLRLAVSLQVHYVVVHDDAELQTGRDGVERINDDPSEKEMQESTIPPEK